MKLAVLLVAGAIAVAFAQTPTRDISALAPVPTGTGAISGVINDETAHPVRRATVSISGDMRVNFSTVTDDQGRFAFSGLPVGRFTVTAKKPAYPSISYGAKRPNRAGSGVLLAEGQKVSGIALTLARGGVLSGIVFDDRGQPMPGVPVMPWEVRTSLSGERTLDFPATGGESVTTDDRGAYRVYGLPPGEYTIGTAWFYSGSPAAIRLPSDAEIRAAFLAVTQQPSPSPAAPPLAAPSSPLTYNYTRVFLPDSIDPLAATTVQLAAGEEREGLDLHMQLRPMSKIEGVVIGPDGPPSTPVELLLVRRNRAQALTSSVVWGAGRDGRFTSVSLGPGDYTIRAATKAAGDTPAMWAMTDVPIDNADPVQVTLRLEPAMVLTGRIVLDATTQPPQPVDLSRVRLTLISTSADGVSTAGAAVIEPSGAFSISGVMPGSFRVMANLPNPSAPGRPIWTLRSVMSGEQEVTDLPMDIAPGNTPSVTVTLTDQVSELSGTLTDASGRPAPDYFVVVLPADRKYWALSSRRIVNARPDVRGQFVFRLPPGDYRIAATTDLVPHDLTDANALSQLSGRSAAVTLAPGEKKIFNIAVDGR